MNGKGCLLLALGGLVTGVVLASACGGEGSPTTAPPTPAPGTPTLALNAPEQVVGNLPAIGVYPTTVQFAEVLRGGEYLRTIGVMNSSDSEQIFSLAVEGEAGPWMSLVDPQDTTQVLDFVSAPPQGEGRAFLRLVVPPDVPNGEHSGAVRVLTTVGQGKEMVGEGSGTSVNVGAEIGVTLDVTGTQNIAGSLMDAATTDVEIGSPLRITTTVQNSGNVQVNPQIDLQILDPAGTVVGQASSAEGALYPNEIKTLTPEWDTTGQRLGERTAHVSVRFGDLEIGAKDVNFNILALGTLTRRGEIEGLAVQGKPSVGSVAKVTATFRNTGEIDTRARFLGEVFRDSVRVDATSSEELAVERGGVASLELFVQVPEKGTYTIRGKVNYEGKETDVQELTFRVGVGEGRPPFWAWVIIGLAGLAGLAVMTVAGWTFRRRLRRRSAG